MFGLKIKIADAFGLSKNFPGQSSVWEMTAAQRAALIGPAKEPAVKRVPMSRLQAVTEQGIESGTLDVGER